MAFNIPYIGAAANDGTGDTLRAGMQKIALNFGMPALIPFSSPAGAPAANQIAYYSSGTAVSYANLTAFGRSLMGAADAAAAVALLGAATVGSIALKANLASPALSGTPSAPTAAAATSTTQIATTAFVTTADNLKANLASPALTGTPTAPTAATGTNTTQLATMASIFAERTAAATLTNKTLTNPVLSALPEPTTAQQAATKNYIDNVWLLERLAVADQALGTNPVGVLLQFPTAGQWANGLTWDGTNHRVTPTEAGTYRFEGFILISTTTSTSDVLVVLYKNAGSPKHILYVQAGTGTAYRGGAFSILTTANGTTDYFDIRVSSSTGGVTAAWSARRLQISRVTRAV